METINFYGTTLARRVINANRIGVQEYGLIVYQTLFYRVRRHIESSIWQVVGTLHVAHDAQYR